MEIKTKTYKEVPKGNYVVKFLGLIRPGNKVALRTGKDDKVRMQFKFVSTDKDKHEIPYSVEWKKDKLRDLCGCLGVPFIKIKTLMENGETEKALLRFEKYAQEAEIEMSLNVGEVGGWGRYLHINEGSFIAEFAGFGTDQDGLPKITHIDNPEAKSNRGGTYHQKVDRCTGKFAVMSGKHKGAILRNPFMSYAIRKEDDEWKVVNDTKADAEFVKLCAMHKVPLVRMDPDTDFKDPDNGLPEIEEQAMKHKVPVWVEVSGGIARSVKKPPEGMTSADLDNSPTIVDDGEASGHLDVLYRLIEKRVQKETGKDAFTEDGDYTVAGKKWAQTHVVPLQKRYGYGSLSKCSDVQVDKLVRSLKA